jgi:Short C-terminal domain
VLPYVGVFVYLLVRGGRRQPAPAPGAGAAGELERLARLHDEGKIDDAEYARAKARVLG